MRPLPLLVVALLTSACHRGEQPGSSAGAEREPQTSASTPTVSADASPAAPAAPSCVVPLASEAPPPAEPAASCPADPVESPPELGRGYVTFVDVPGAPRIGVEVADDPAERERGLMYRTSMPEEQGMLFSWPDERVRSFWMRNTCIPLDMLFIDSDGFVLGILEQVPVMNERSRSIPCPAAHVLEVNAGYCRSHGVKPGQRVAFE